MPEIELVCGERMLPVSLPESSTIVEFGRTYEDPPHVDPAAATELALERPHGSPPLKELVGPGSRVAIAFPDRVKGGTHATAHRKVALPIVLRILDEAGVRDEDISLVCAIGLHRKNTREEMAEYLPREVLDRFGPDRLVNHDAEDPDGIVDLPDADHGEKVAFNRACAEADLCIVLGHAMGNPYGGYSGGYKTSTTGLTTWESIASHHTPATMHRHDFVPINPRSHFRSQLRAIGRTIEEQTGAMFVIDAVPGRHADVLGVYAGAPEAVEEASWPLAARRTNVELDAPPADVLTFGLPRSFHYGPGMGTNPVLMNQAISANIARSAGAFKKGGVAIVTAQCDGWFNEDWFPSYEETFELYRRVGSVDGLKDHEREFAEQPEWVRAYREDFTYHPFHAFSMLYMGAIGLQHASEILIVGAERPDFAEAMGLTPIDTYDQALQRARRSIGHEPHVLALPDFLKGAAVHLHSAASEAA